VTAASRPRGDRPVAVADHVRARKGEHRVRNKQTNAFFTRAEREEQRGATPAGSRARGGAMADGGGWTKAAPTWLKWRHKGEHGVSEKKAERGARGDGRWWLTVSQFGRQRRRWRSERGARSCGVVRRRAVAGKNGEEGWKRERGRLEGRGACWRQPPTASCRRRAAHAGHGARGACAAMDVSRHARASRHDVRAGGRSARTAGPGHFADRPRREATAH
jgi:hypothetical protein